MPTNENLRYPVSTDTPDVPRDIKNLTDDIVARTFRWMETETLTITASALATGVFASASGDHSKFGHTTPPDSVIVALGPTTAGGSGYLVPRCDQITATTYRVAVFNVGTAAATFTNQPVTVLLIWK